MDFKFRVQAKFKNNACDNLDTIIHMGGTNQREAENRVIDHIVNTYENDFLDVETVRISLIKKEKNEKRTETF